MSLNILRRRRRPINRKKQRGSMLVIAVFVITVMVFLAVALQDIFSNAADSVAYEVYGTRALSAANSGAEQALQKIFYLNGQTALDFSADEPANATATLNLDLSNTVAFHGCTVVANITRFTINNVEFFYNFTHYRVESTATCEAGNFKTVRTIAVEGRER
ncbi:MAG: MSHA biogenesis protein MshP [Psychrosphaera sp.]|nr:MSHA biogenesis protein MshP [Psychrosphaera sp.]